MNINLAISLLEEYQKLLQQRKDYERFRKENPGEFCKGKYPSVTELKRTGVMARKLMVEIEDNFNNYKFTEEFLK